MKCRSLYSLIRKLMLTLRVWLNDTLGRFGSSRPLQILELRKDGRQIPRNVYPGADSRLLRQVFLWTLFLIFLLAVFNLANARDLTHVARPALH